MSLTKLTQFERFSITAEDPQYAAVVAEIEARIGRGDLTAADQVRGTRLLRERLQADPYRPRYHLLPPDSYWNDINGAIYWNGRYHLFFLGRQTPEAEAILSGTDTVFARENWLHASSADLVHWVWHPVALEPQFDGSMPRGIWSGGAVHGASVPTLIYYVPGQGVCIATADDDELIHWTPSEHNPVIPENRPLQGDPSNPPPGNWEAEYIVFDPCGWKEGDTYYALVGNRNRRPGFEGDTTSLFRSPDLIHWEYLHPFYKSDRKWTDIACDAACPDFFPMGDKYMLVTHVHRPSHRCQYYIGSYENEVFTPEQHGFMNWPGGPVAGPETLLDAAGRRIFWGWVRETKPIDNNWGSMTTLPRIFTLGDDGTLRINPAPELDALRHGHQSLAPFKLAAGSERVLDTISGNCLELCVRFVAPESADAVIRVFRSADGTEQTDIIYSAEQGTLSIDTSRASLNPQVRYDAIAKDYAERNGIPEAERVTHRQIAPFKAEPGETVTLRIFLDRSILEVFANERQCITQRVYPTLADSVGVSLLATGAALNVLQIDAWRMHPVNSW